MSSRLVHYDYIISMSRAPGYEFSENNVKCTLLNKLIFYTFMWPTYLDRTFRNIHNMMMSLL